MKNVTYHIDLEEDAKPISTGASLTTIPELYLPALKKELDDLEARGIILKIDYFTPMLPQVVVVPKKGRTKICMCVDFAKLNRFAKCPVNLQPTTRETVRNLPKGTNQVWVVF
jgi:hypothetical protein